MTRSHCSAAKRARFVALLAVTTAIVGCSSPSDETETGAIDLRVTPNGDEILASFVLAVPAGACADPSCGILPGDYWLVGPSGEKPVAVGENVRVAPGSYTLRQAAGSAIQTTFELRAAATSTLDLGIVKTVCTREPLPSVEPTDFGYVPRVGHNPCPSRMYFNGTFEASSEVSLPEGAKAVLPGTYSLQMTTGLAWQSRTIAPGERVDIAIDLPALGVPLPALVTTKISFEPAELPTVGEPLRILNGCDDAQVYQALQRNEVSLKAYDVGCGGYVAMIGGRSVRLSDLAHDVKLRRLDVNDVTVTREDGTTYTTAGTYTLSFGVETVFGPVATGTGTDLFPGSYQLVVSYQTALGLQVKSYPINL